MEFGCPSPPPHSASFRTLLRKHRKGGPQQPRPVLLTQYNIISQIKGYPIASGAKQPGRGPPALGQHWASSKVLTLFSLSPAPMPLLSLSHCPAPSLVPTCLPTHSAPRPLVLDPADPTWNVGQGCWKLLAQEAAALEMQACLMGTKGTPVQPWDVMVRDGSRKQ